MHMKLSKTGDWKILISEKATLPWFLAYCISNYQFGLSYKSGSRSSVLLHSPHPTNFQTLSALCHHSLAQHYLPLYTYYLLKSVCQHASTLITVVSSHWLTNLLSYISPFHPLHSCLFVWFLMLPLDPLTLPLPNSAFVPAMLSYL